MGSHGEKGSTPLGTRLIQSKPCNHHQPLFLMFEHLERVVENSLHATSFSFILVSTHPHFNVEPWHNISYLEIKTKNTGDDKTDVETDADLFEGLHVKCE